MLDDAPWTWQYRCIMSRTPRAAQPLASNVIFLCPRECSCQMQPQHSAAAALVGLVPCVIFLLTSSHTFSWNKDMGEFFQDMPGRGTSGVYANIYDDLDTTPVAWHISEVANVLLVCHSVTLSLCYSVTVCICVCIFVPLCVWSVPVYISVPVSSTVCVPVCVSISVSVSVSVSVSESIVCPCLQVAVCVCASVCLCFHISCRSMCLRFHISCLSMSISESGCLGRVCLGVSVSMCQCAGVSVCGIVGVCACVWQCDCVFVYVCVCACVCVFECMYACVHVFNLCVRVSVSVCLSVSIFFSQFLFCVLFASQPVDPTEYQNEWLGQVVSAHRPSPLPPRPHLDMQKHTLFLSLSLHEDPS